MSRSKKQKDPFRTLLRGVLLLALGAILCAAIFYGLNAFEKHALDQKIKDTQAINQKREQEYNAAVAEYQSAAQSGQNMAWPSHKAEGWDIVDLSAFGLENTQTMQADRATLLIGGMLLDNQWHKLPEDFSVNDTQSVITASGKKVGASSTKVKLFLPAIRALESIYADAATAGMKNLVVDEGMRTMEEQQAFFDAKMAQLQNKYSGDTLFEQTKKQVNEPGTSEYQSGFSFEMTLYPNPDKLYFQDSEQGKWFIENCWKYGFIFRFPAKDFPNSSWLDKSFKTGVSIKLNVFRWVGIPHATVMRQLNLCLEEYIEYLMVHPHIAVYENNTLKYEIYRRPVGNEATVSYDVPLAAVSHLPSLDNMGGLITAFIYQ